MLSFTLSGKHMSYPYTHLTHKTITYNIIFMHLYYELMQILLITGLRLFGSPVGVIEPILMRDLSLLQSYVYSGLP